MENAVIVVQARMTSTRLPGKVLRPVNGKPMLAYTLERLANVSGSPNVVVATSNDPSDDGIVDFCNASGIPCHRGPLTDVAERYLQLIAALEPSCFVRICGDSPLIDQAIVSRALEVFDLESPDLVTNVMPRTFPKGQSVEVVRSGAFRKMCASLDNDSDREHVTQCFYQNPDKWSVVNIANGNDVSDVNLSVDTLDDFVSFSSLIMSMSEPHWTYGLDEILALSRILCADKS